MQAEQSTQGVITSSLLTIWSVSGSIVAAATPFNQIIKTPGYDTEIIKVVVSLYGVGGAILPQNNVDIPLDRTTIQLMWADTNMQIANQPLDIFMLGEAWNHYFDHTRFILKRDTNVQVTAAIDTTTNNFAGQYPIRFELDFVGIRRLTNS